MSAGDAWRFGFDIVTELAELINHLGSDEAIALGALHPGLPDSVQVVTKIRRQKLSLTKRPHLIARTSKYLGYRAGRPAPVLIDIDTKGMPLEVRRRVDELGGSWSALVSVIPELATAARVVRASTSAGIRRAGTREVIPGSDGLHVFVLIRDGSDVERLLRDFHARCWLAGLGWCRISVSGQVLDRSLVDRMVARPEGLIFEGSPNLDPALVQDTEARRAVSIEGEILDSAAVCLPLSSTEEADLAELRAREAQRLATECAAARQAFLKRQARRLMDQNPSMSRDVAERAIARQVDEGVLLPSVKLDFVDETLAGKTVGDVLENPERFVGEKLADPIEGPAYDPDCAYVNLREDGTPWIYSFAHGGATYQLKYDAAAIERAIETAPPDKQAAELFVKLMMVADDLDPIDVERLKNLVCARSGTGPRALMASLGKARDKIQRERRHDEKNEQRRAKTSLDDFFANLEMHNYIYTPTGKMWPPSSVNARIQSHSNQLR